MASKRLSVRLSDVAQKQLVEIVKATGMTESEVVRKAIAEYWDKLDLGPSAYDVAMKAGLIGCVEGGPDDLSVNPIYMEGFGRD
jgi:predicted transcriptional regulator